MKIGFLRNIRDRILRHQRTIDASKIENTNINNHRLLTEAVIPIVIAPK
tara:strand:- start:21 stop:167 length:147 start_codon:yes stop_codon:yes gene_type:complete